MFNDYLLLSQKNVIINILDDPDIEKHFSLNINFVQLFEEDPTLGNLILKKPNETLLTCNQSIKDVQLIIIKDNDQNLVLLEKINVHTRIYGLPICPELHRTIFPKNQDLDLFLQVSGTVVRMTAIKMLEYMREYICAKCKFKIMVEAEYDQKYIIVPPKTCKNPEFCKSTKFVVVNSLNSNCCRDYQEIKIQEQFSKLESGSMPNSMWITLENNLVDICKPGDNVTICGIIKRRWKPPVVGKKLDVELVINANHILVNNDTNSTILITPEIKEQFHVFWEKYAPYPLYGRELLLRSFCPQICGMYLVKLAIATVLSGGSQFQRSNDTGVTNRSESHILLVGDPGTGKSQLLKYAAKVIPRSVLTTGIGSTSAGLTVSAVMEDGEWQLEGGALVLADGGICCIDEFNSMKAHDRTSIHEAMEQQTISVAKASICCKLSTKCSILAATNPKGSLDTNESISMNIALESPLLSRFDLILLLKDNVDSNWDELVADFILRGHKYKSKFMDDKNNSWSLEMLQAYFMIIKNINPVLTDISNKILSSYYQLQRRAVDRNKARTTVRLLDSLVRLSQAHARLMYHSEVQVMDAITAVILVEASMEGEAATLSLDFDIHSDYPDDPMEEYAQLAKVVLEKLGLHGILDAELKRWKKTVNENNSKYFENKNKPNDKVEITTSQNSKLNHINKDFIKTNLERKQKVNQINEGIGAKIHKTINKNVEPISNKIMVTKKSSKSNILGNSDFEAIDNSSKNNENIENSIVNKDGATEKCFIVDNSYDNIKGEFELELSTHKMVQKSETADNFKTHENPVFNSFDIENNELEREPSYIVEENVKTANIFENKGNNNFNKVTNKIEFGEGPKEKVIENTNTFKTKKNKEGIKLEENQKSAIIENTIQLKRKNNKTCNKFKKRKSEDILTDYQMINLIPSANLSKELEEALNYEDPDEAPKQNEFNNIVSQNTKMKNFKRKFSFKPREKNVLADKLTSLTSFNKSDSGNFSQCSQLSTRTIFENENVDELNFDL